MATVRNVIQDLKRLKPTDEIIVSYWTREDLAETLDGELTDGMWEYFLNKFYVPVEDLELTADNYRDREAARS